MRLPFVGEATRGPISLRGSVGLWALGVLIFWWPWLIGPMAPLLGDAQAAMLPWRAATTPPPYPRWDALLWDGMAQYYPWRVFAARLARRGLIPLWNPHQFCGTPFIANGQSAFFYPPNVLFWLLDARYAFALSSALHYFIAGCFMILLGRELGVRPVAGLVGAAAYSMGGFMVAWTALPTLMNTAAWLPAVTWAIERAFRRDEQLGFLAIAITLLMVLLAGHPQVAIYVWLVAALHLLARTAWSLYQRRMRELLRLLVAPAVAVLLASGQLLPTLELVGRSPRGKAAPNEQGFEFRRERAMQPAMLETLISPDALGTPDDWAKAGLAYSETCAYIGRAALALALCALVGRRSRAALCLAALAALALVAAMGGPVARFLYFCVPGLAQAGGFGRVLCVYTFAMAVLAAMGTDWLAGRVGRIKSVPWAPKLGVWVPVLAAVLVCLEVGSWARGFLPRSPRARIYPSTQLTELLARLCRNGDRVLVVTYRSDWTIHKLPNALLPPNAATAYGYNDVQGYDSLYPASFARYAALLAPDGYTPITNGNMVLIDDLQGLAQRGEYIRWIAVPAGASPPGDQFVRRWEGEGVTLFENLNARPRIWSSEPGSAGQAGSEKSPDVIGVHVGLQTEVGGDPCLLRIDLPAIHGTHVSVADTPYPGWTAYVDGRPCPMHPALGLGWWVPVSGKAKHLDIVYRPASFVVGAFVSLLAMGGTASWVWWHCGRTRSRRRGEGTRPHV